MGYCQNELAFQLDLLDRADQLSSLGVQLREALGGTSSAAGGLAQERWFVTASPLKTRAGSSGFGCECR